LGTLGVAWAVWFRWWFRDRPEQHPGCNEAERALISPPREGGESARPAGHAWPGVRALAGSVTVWAMCFASLWVCFGWYVSPTWQPKSLEDASGARADARQWGVLPGLPFLCGAAGALAGGRLSDRLVARTGSRRWGRSLVGLAGFTGAGLCVLATGFVT